MILSIHIAKGAIIAVVRRFDHEDLRQVQNYDIIEVNLSARHVVYICMYVRIMYKCMDVDVPV